jgi:hypothetical protein
MNQSSANLINTTEKPIWDQKIDQDKMNKLEEFNVDEIRGVEHHFSKWNKDKQNPFLLDDNQIEIPEHPDVMGKFFWLLKFFSQTRGR